MTPLRINRLHHPVTVLGWGTRVGVWLQGCSLGCHGCASQDTWSPTAGEFVTPEEIMAWLTAIPGRLDGLTVSGGEPFEQPEALAELLGLVDDLRNTGKESFDVLVYSGLSWSRLRREPGFRPALDRCDAVVAGPYVARRNTGTPLRGSDNQQIVTLTGLGRERYGPASVAPARPRMQVSVADGQLRMIGIPGPGDLDRLRARLEDSGIALDDVSWQP